MKLADLQAFAATLAKREIVAEKGIVYLERYLIHGWSPASPKDAPPGVSLYLHHILLPDQDDPHVLHNHPWRWAHSTILHGWYAEERPHKLGGFVSRSYPTGSSNTLEPETFHRITSVSHDCWTLFLTGPKVKSWGFDVPGRGFVPWRERLAARGITPDY